MRIAISPPARSDGMEEKIMTDKEMLMVAYGALKIMDQDRTYGENIKAICKLIEGHIYPQPVVIYNAEPGIKLP